MGLYLCVFDGEGELDGVEVGHYADFNALRDYVVRELEDEVAGSKFPVLIMHSDSDGEWSVQDVRRLIVELNEIAALLKVRPPVSFSSEWKGRVAKSIGLHPKNAFESFFDIDGEFLVERLIGLADVAIKANAPVIFQ